MTRDELFVGVRAMGLSIKATGQGREVRIAYAGPNQEASAYYTDDREDAFATAQHMAASRDAAGF